MSGSLVKEELRLGTFFSSSASFPEKNQSGDCLGVGNLCKQSQGWGSSRAETGSHLSLKSALPMAEGGSAADLVLI